MFEHIKINDQKSLKDNIKELIASCDDVVALAKVAAGAESIYINYEPHGKWWLSIGVWCSPNLKVHTFDDEFYEFEVFNFSNAADIAEQKDKLMTDLNENGYSFDPSSDVQTILKGLLSQRIDKEVDADRVFYAEVPHTGSSGQIIEYYGMTKLKNTFINLAHNTDNCFFTSFKSKEDAISLFEEVDDDEEVGLFDDVVTAIKALPDGVGVHIWHDGVSGEVAEANDANEFDWAWEVVTHDFQSASYICFGDK